jgi:DNA-binding NtrC family response regulator
LRPRASSPNGVGPDDIRRALRRSDGNLTATAKALGLNYYTLRARLKSLGMRDELRKLRDGTRARRHERELREMMRLLTKHHGNVSHVARVLGIRQSSMAARIEKFDLRDVVESLRPRKPTPDEERTLILAAIRKHRGQMWRVRAELRMPKSTLLLRMRKYDLFAEADALRVEANLIGPRTRLPQGRNRKERRAKLLAIIESCGWNLSQAWRKVGVSQGTFYTMLHDLGIERPARLKPEHRLHRLVDALRMSRGVIGRAALWMKVPSAIVLRWCREFEIDPKDYRR